MKNKQKLQASARSLSRSADDGYDDEPNMKLSNAFYVMLVLHLVAVAGIFTFSRIKAQQASPLDTAYQPEVVNATADDTPAAKPTPAPVPVAPPKKTADAPRADTGVKDSGDFYTVAKGDNPVAIARKLHVSYAALLKLNKIDDPKKLQIGQKLRIPQKTKPVKVD